MVERVLYDLSMFEGEQFGNRGIETKHFDGYDLVINHAQTEIDQDKLEGLVKIISALLEEKKITKDRFGDWPELPWGDLGKHYIDKRDNPRFFVKRKWADPDLPHMDGIDQSGFMETIRQIRTKKRVKKLRQCKHAIV